ncbi:GMP synthase [glutamine-hydrolyzing] subunit B [ANME-1 cluster archaeon GoMg3.2]|nr:GMP synthase [glutamine-hydrolyzing] subunit B [ANME-1 cluster archaeon GoMg3.2]
MFEPEKFIEKQVDEVKETIGDEKAVIATSGGVDSTVCAVLTYRAIGDQAVIVFIDDGLMREGEAEQVTNFFKALNMNTRLVDAATEFFDALKGITEPEEKRKAFRNTFYSVLGRVVREENAKYLVQGTIAADILETVKGIKTQHNILEQIGIDPGSYGLTIVEPLREIYKHEVREVARSVDLPAEFSERPPFPGPGLATRTLGEVTPERVEIERRATKIVEEETSAIESFQSMAVLMNDKATGIRDGKRAYGYIIVVRLVKSKDAITAEAVNVPWTVLKRIDKRITTEIPEVVHVLYSLTDKPPATIEFQ